MCWSQEKQAQVHSTLRCTAGLHIRTSSCTSSPTTHPMSRQGSSTAVRMLMQRRLRTSRSSSKETAYPVSYESHTCENPQPEWITMVTVPYVKGPSEAIRWILSEENIRLAFKSKTTMRSILTRVRPRLATSRKQKGGDILQPMQRLNHSWW